MSTQPETIHRRLGHCGNALIGVLIVVIVGCVFLLGYAIFGSSSSPPKKPDRNTRLDNEPDDADEIAIWRARGNLKAGTVLTSRHFTADTVSPSEFKALANPLTSEDVQAYVGRVLAKNMALGDVYLAGNLNPSDQTVTTANGQKKEGTQDVNSDNKGIRFNDGKDNRNTPVSNGDIIIPGLAEVPEVEDLGDRVRAWLVKRPLNVGQRLGTDDVETKYIPAKLARNVPGLLTGSPKNFVKKLVKKQMKVGTILTHSAFETDEPVHYGKIEVFEPSGTKPSEGWPVLICLHGWQENIHHVKPTAELAAKHGFVSVAVSGQYMDKFGGFRWSYYIPRDTHYYIQRTLKKKGFLSRKDIDPSRVFLHGYSQGALQAAFIACEFPKSYAGVFGVAIAQANNMGPLIPKYVSHPLRRTLVLMWDPYVTKQSKVASNLINTYWIGRKIQVKYRGGNERPVDWENIYPKVFDVLKEERVPLATAAKSPTNDPLEPASKPNKPAEDKKEPEEKKTPNSIDDVINGPVKKAPANK